MNTTNFGTLLAEAAEKMKREAYAAGWRDAIAALTKSMNELVDPATMGNFEIGDAQPVASGAISRTTNSKLPKQGSTPWEVLQVVKKRPGMTTVQVVEAMKTGGHSAPEGSIRTSIFRMKTRKFIVARHNKWYPA